MKEINTKFFCDFCGREISPPKEFMTKKDIGQMSFKYGKKILYSDPSDPSGYFMTQMVSIMEQHVCLSCCEKIQKFLVSLYSDQSEKK
jgi:hypothetical protein